MFCVCRSRLLTVYSFYTWRPRLWHVYDLLCNLHRRWRQACPRAQCILADKQAAKIKAPLHSRESSSVDLALRLFASVSKAQSARSGALLPAHTVTPLFCPPFSLSICYLSIMFWEKVHAEAGRWKRRVIIVTQGSLHTRGCAQVPMVKLHCCNAQGEGAKLVSYCSLLCCVSRRKVK